VGTVNRAAALVTVLAGVLAQVRLQGHSPCRRHSTGRSCSSEAIRTHVVVKLDRTQVRMGSLRVVDDVAPLTVLTRRRRRARCAGTR
jgi:hypothetical protein